MNEMITIPRAEYEALIEARDDLEDIAAFDRAKVDGGESIPSDAVARIINGESPLRVFRELRGLTQAELASRAEVHRVTVAEIETGRKNGSLDALKRLAAALSVTVDDLI